MDKSDLEMEEAEKKAQDVENNVLELQTDTVDSNLEVEGTNLQCVAAELPVKYENGVTLQTEDPSSNSKSEAKSLINGDNEDGEQNIDSVAGDQKNVNDKTEDRSGSKGEHLSNVSSEAEDQKNGTSVTEAHGDVVVDDKNSSKIESQGPNNAEGEGEGDDKITGGAETPNPIKIENIEGELEGDVVLQNKEPTTDVAQDDTGSGNVQLPDDEIHKIDEGEVDEVHQSEKMIFEVNQNGNGMMIDERKDSQIETNPETVITDADGRSGVLPNVKNEVSDTASEKMPEPLTAKSMESASTAKAGQHSGEASKNIFKEAKADDEDEFEDGDDDGSPEDQAAFMRELESFYRERAMEFKPLKFYGHPLNLLKLWRSVIRLGGYDLVTGSKLWRQVGESFNPPKTCTTISWTFRTFYEKALLEYERHKKQSGELQLAIAAPPVSSGVDNEGNGHQASASGRTQRDAAARAMQGWHEQRRVGYGEDKNANNVPKRETNLKSTCSLKHKRQNEVEQPVKAARTETSKQLVTPVVDVGPPADWVKINVRETRDCFEVYAVVPGLMREEVRVQTDPAGRVVISGEPEQPDNPWGVTAFKKEIRLPGRIDPFQTSAILSLHGRLCVRLPFAQ